MEGRSWAQLDVENISKHFERQQLQLCPLIFSLWGISLSHSIFSRCNVANVRWAVAYLVNPEHVGTCPSTWKCITESSSHLFLPILRGEKFSPDIIHQWLTKNDNSFLKKQTHYGWNVTLVHSEQHITIISGKFR